MYFDHLEQFGIRFQAFKNIPQNVPCIPDCVILGELSFWCSSNQGSLLKLTWNNATAIWNINCGAEGVNGAFEQIMGIFWRKFHVFQIVYALQTVLRNLLYDKRKVYRRCGFWIQIEWCKNFSSRIIRREVTPSFKIWFFWKSDIKICPGDPAPCRHVITLQHIRATSNFGGALKKGSWYVKKAADRSGVFKNFQWPLVLKIP